MVCGRRPTLLILNPGQRVGPRPVIRSALVVLWLTVALAAVGHAEPRLSRLPADEWPALQDDLDRGSLATVLRRSLAALEKKPGSRTVAFAGTRVTVGRLRDSLTAFLALLDRTAGLSSDDFARAVRRDFDIYRVRTPVRFTAYHEPELPGSAIRTERYRYPLYAPPDDLVRGDPEPPRSGKDRPKGYGRLVGGTLVPYFSRAEIDGEGVLRGRGKEVVWLDDPVERFFLHIQGSGKIRLPDGGVLRVGYAGSNGWPYRSIGELLLSRDELGPGGASAQGLRRYLRRHPHEQNAVLFHNPRYIFFRPVPDGPLGSLGVTLTPGRSIATDPRWYPPGALGFIATTRPERGADGTIAWREFSRFVSLQDRGAAITGPGRVDIYWGSGPQPEAGLMSQRGILYVLLEKDR